jgi:geranylgeranyl pyrophosphate synthase
VSAEAELLTRKLRVIALVADAAGAGGMVGGQAIDLDAVRPGPRRAPVTLSAEDVQQMHARKTGALIRASAVSGAIMAGADSRTTDAIERYAADIGLAFQIIDDLLDVEAATETLGKTAGKDAAAGKPTYPSLYGLARSRQLAAECLQRAIASLSEVGLADTHLAGIAQWIVARRS